MFGISTIKLALIAVALIALAVVARNCRLTLHPPQPKVITKSFTVVRAISGGQLEVATGRRERKTTIIWLTEIAPPALDSQYAEASRASLEKLAGAEIRVEWPKQGLLRAAEDDNEAQSGACENCDGTGKVQPPQAWIDSHPQDKDRLDECPICGGTGTLVADALLARNKTIKGIVYGAGGCLQLAQLQAGMVDTLPSAPKAWQKAKQQAQQNKLGMWQVP